MAIRGFDERYFYPLLHDNVRPARAVDDPTRLYGRGEKLRDTRRALATPGRQVFIFGERGVGKTSLAKTAVRADSPHLVEPILVACDRSSTFVSVINSLIRNLLAHCTKRPPQLELNAGFNLLGISLSSKLSWTAEGLTVIEDINDAVLVFKTLAASMEHRPAVIIDEFDVLQSHEEKGRFAEFIKQASDQSLNMKFVFCGIANDVDSLIGSHFSSGRYIEPVELGPLRPGDLFHIMETACQAFQLTLDREFLIRAALIADGFPYFMHLITEHLLITVFEDHQYILTVRATDFQGAVDRSVQKSEPMLKSAYDKATKKYLDDYQEVLWAVSAMKVFENKWQDIYERAYLPIMASRHGRLELDQATFYQRILKLTHEGHGRILSANLNGWYKFSENVIRSYVRLRAAEAGVDLGIDLHGSQYRPELTA